MQRPVGQSASRPVGRSAGRPVGQQRQANESFDALERRHDGIADMRDTGVDGRQRVAMGGQVTAVPDEIALVDV